MTRGQAEACLTDAGLKSIIPKLDTWGVHELEDLLILEDTDVHATDLNVVEKRKLKNLLQKLRGGSLLSAAACPLMEPPSPVQTMCSSVASSGGGTWHLAGNHDSQMDGSWLVEDSDFTTSGLFSSLCQQAVKPGSFEVPCFIITGGMPKLQEVRKLYHRPVHWRMKPDDGWKFMTMEFPGPKRLQELQDSVERYRKPGFEHNGRRYYFVCSSKPAKYPRGPTAWLASPPGDGGLGQIGELIGFADSLVLEKKTNEMPYPRFRLRARGKQLFSSIIATISAAAVTIQLQKSFEEEGVRDDGAGEADPEILQALANASNARQEESGRSRSIPASAQIRCGGLKGMLLGTKRLAGTGSVEVPENMLKFGPKTFGAEQLSVVSFSRVRPTSLGLDAVLRLEACGCKADTFLRQHQQCLKKIGGMRREDVFGQLYFAEYEHDPELEAEDEHSAELTSKHYIGTFLDMLIAGYDPNQHPLLEVILRQKESALRRAKRQVRVRGCWSARGHPEPRESRAEDENPLLRDNEVFLMVPCDVEETGWKALTGKVIVNYLSDRDPYALRLAVAKDSPALRAKCEPGVLFFSRVGCPLQKNLSWDFDGDYFQIITDEEVVNSFSGSTLPMPEPEYEHGDLNETPVDTWADVNAHFLSEYLQKDRMGLLHYQWQLIAGRGPQAACCTEARTVAAAYAKSLDVEKGKRCPKQNRFGKATKWDFMNDGDPHNPSPTAAGKCFRAASRAEQEFKEAVRDPARSLGKDPDLDKAWQLMEQELGKELCQRIKALAKNVRKEFLERVRAECDAAERVARDKHPYSSGEMVLKEEWIWELRSRTAERAEELTSQKEIGLTFLTQVAVAGWHLKYVDENVSSQERDPNPSFPWTLFKQELTALKDHYQPCPMSELQRNHRLFRKLQRSAAKELQDKVGEALDGLKFDMKCKECSRDREMLLASLTTHGSFSETVAAVKDVSGRGELIKVDICDLRYCKDSISDVFDHGPHAGMKLQDLVQKLLREGPASDLELTALKFHGHLYVIEGNKRLWCLKEAQKEMNQKIEVSVRVPNLYLGFVQRQDRKEPALPYFLQRFNPRSRGLNVVLQHEQQCTTEQGCAAGAACQTSIPAVSERADLQDAGKTILRCSKHRGCTFAEAYQKPGFAKWVIENIDDSSDARMQELKAYFAACRACAHQPQDSYPRATVPTVNERATVPTVNDRADMQDASKTILRCSKHRGCTFAEAYQKPGFAKWVIENIDQNSDPRMQELKAYFES
ncbi:RDR2 [Symbiodinium sp. CCMP2456]|nr:RDR2 [Symbiodinium sp. CCMP2456]